jgi:hypothetical protein
LTAAGSLPSKSSPAAPPGVPLKTSMVMPFIPFGEVGVPLAPFALTLWPLVGEAPVRRSRALAKEAFWSSIHSGINVASSEIFSLILSRLRRSTALCDSLRRRFFSLASAALGGAQMS